METSDTTSIVIEKFGEKLITAAEGAGPPDSGEGVGGFICPSEIPINIIATENITTIMFNVEYGLELAIFNEL